MAIFGTLEEMPLPELLTMLGRRTGRLQLSELPQEQNYNLYLDKAQLKAVSSGQDFLTNDLAVREAIIKLTNFDKGIFEFKRLAQDELKQHIDIPIDRLLLQTATAIDEIQLNKERFPDAKTRFKTSGQVEVWIDDVLYNFWQSCSPLLNKGCSAEEVSQNLSIDLELVQHNLYKLRSLGKIAPVRLFEEKPTPSISSAPKPAKNLSQNIDNMSYKEIISWLQSSESEGQETVIEKEEVAISKKPEPSVHTKGLVSRLLTALRRK